MTPRGYDKNESGKRNRYKVGDILRLLIDTRKSFDDDDDEEGEGAENENSAKGIGERKKYGRVKFNAFINNAPLFKKRQEMDFSGQLDESECLRVGLNLAEGVQATLVPFGNNSLVQHCRHWLIHLCQADVEPESKRIDANLNSNRHVY